MAQSNFVASLQKIYTLIPRTLRWNFFRLCLCNMGMAFFEMGVAGSISLLGVAMASPQALVKNSFFEQILRRLPLPSQLPLELGALILMMSFVAAATVGKNMFLAYLTWRQNIFAQRIAWAVGSSIFQKYLHAPHIWHMQQNSAELLAYLGWKVQIANYLVNVLVLFTQIVITVCLLGSALVANPLMSCFFFSTITVFAALIYKFARSRAYDCGNALREYDLQNIRVSMQGLHGICEVTIADKQSTFIAAFQQYIPQYVKTAGKQSLYAPLPVWVLESTGMLLLLGVLILLVHRGASVAETTGILMLLAAISWRLLPAVNKALGAMLSLKGQQPIVERLLAQLHDIPDAVQVCPREIRHLRESFTVEHVSFTYPQSAQPALRDVSIRIPRGQMIGLIGLSGSGKSTLTGILTGMLQPDSGELRVDGQHWDNAFMRLPLGYVPQNLYLLDASLADNVAFRVWGEGVDENRVQECCRLAAMDFVETLPEGMETVLGERGVRLSGGQIQRVGIARALYGAPELLIFDEATSALDGATEQTIQHTIDGLRQSVTMLLIAHRLSTVQRCDYIYWLDTGKIRMEGKPDDVLPAYSRYLDKRAQKLSCVDDAYDG